MTQNTLSDEIELVVEEYIKLTANLISNKAIEIKNPAAFHTLMEKVSISHSSIAEKTVEAVRVKGCRYGCYCALCALCNKDTHIHCSDCVMTKPTPAVTEQSKRAERWLGNKSDEAVANLLDGKTYTAVIK